MRLPFHIAAERGRLASGPYGSKAGEPFGAFQVPFRRSILGIIASDGLDWAEQGFPPPAFEHVSVSVVGEKRCPTWEEMCEVKRMFWRDDEVVIQYHPAKADYVSHHEFCLHLWRPIGVTIPTPPPVTVGPKGGAA